MQISVCRDRLKCRLESILVSQVAHWIVNNVQHTEEEVLARTSVILMSAGCIKLFIFYV